MTSEAGNIMEGFICPACMIDFNSPTQLTKHFEESHNEDPEILKSLKDFLGKAKNKILKKGELYENPVVPKNGRKNGSPEGQNQEIGLTRSHTGFFKEIRDTRMERYSSETNKLLIRLDKLLNNLPSDPIERKVHEQTIVPWINETDVNLCPSCAKSFHLTRRKHHCRLCGSIMCQACTKLLSIIDAKKMTSPTPIQDDLMLSPTEESQTYPGRLIKAGIGFTKLVRSPSSSSLNSVISMISDPNYVDKNFKLCHYCYNLLDAREKLKARLTEKPIAYEIYEKMRTQIDEASRYIEMYNKMWLSLGEGETTYDLRDAQLLRVKIAKIGDNIDTASKRILSLGPPDDPDCQRSETRLYKMVRSAAKLFLKEQLSTIPNVPTEEEYAMLQEMREKRIQDKIANIKFVEMEEHKERLKQQQSSTSNQIVLDQQQGWSASSPNFVSQTDDPYLEQINILREYIKQAKEDCKFDEAAILEKNLNELYEARRQQSEETVI